jgi:hypothetical protein
MTNKYSVLECSLELFVRVCCRSHPELCSEVQSLSIELITVTFI